jgi:hypothetical protein
MTGRCTIVIEADPTTRCEWLQGVGKTESSQQRTRPFRTATLKAPHVGGKERHHPDEWDRRSSLVTATVRAQRVADERHVIGRCDRSRAEREDVTRHSTLAERTGRTASGGTGRSTSPTRSSPFEGEAISTPIAGATATMSVGPKQCRLACFGGDCKGATWARRHLMSAKCQQATSAALGTDALQCPHFDPLQTSDECGPLGSK